MSTTPQKPRKINPVLFQNLAAKQKPPIREVVGLERAYELQKNPAEEHVIPYGSASQHSRNRSCACHPKVTQQKNQWWQVTVTHRVPETYETGLQPDDPAWEDLKNLSPDAGLPPHLRNRQRR